MSFITPRIHITSSIPLDKALNSASVLDLKTMFCFLLLYLIRFPPKRMQYPIVDLRSINESAESELVKMTNSTYLFS